MKSNSERIVQMCFLLLCVRVIVQCLLHWDALEANDTYFVTRPGPGCLARACPRMIGCWSDSCPTENKGQLRMADALPGPPCSAATGWKPFTCLFPLFALGEPCAGLRLLTRTHKEGKGERSIEDHSPDFAEVPGEWKPFRDGKQNKTKQRKRAIKKELELVLLPSYQPSSLTRDSLLFIFTDGLLRHTKTGEAFVFNAREDLHRWNQKRYEALGEVI